MKTFLVVALLLAPSATRADFVCQIDRICDNGGCAPIDNYEIKLNGKADSWSMTIDYIHVDAKARRISSWEDDSGVFAVTASPDDARGAAILITIDLYLDAGVSMHTLLGTGPNVTAGYGKCTGDES